MSKKSIDLQPMPGADDDGGKVRHVYRVPASDKDNVLAILYQKTYSVSNISSTGIAIPAESCLEFESGQIIEDAELWLGTQRLTNLTAKVVHCSVHDTGELQFGITWLNMDPKKDKILQKVIGQMKARALKNDQLPEDQA